MKNNKLIDMQLNIKGILIKVKIYGRYLSEFLLPDQVDILAKSLKKQVEKELSIYGISDRLEPICAKEEPLIIEMNKDQLVELYNFAYEQAVKTGKVDELKEIDVKNTKIH